MKSIVVIVLLLSSSAALAQNAQVVQLSAADAATAKELYAQQASIQDKIDKFNADLKDRYLTEPYKSSMSCATLSGKPCTQTKEGWFMGFVFSTDFKFIVPKVLQTPTRNYEFPYGTTPSLACGSQLVYEVPGETTSWYTSPEDLQVNTFVKKGTPH